MEKKVLIVDDEKSIRDMLEEAFSELDYKISTASSAEEALDLIKEETFPLMILDLNLPGMNGVELCRRVRKINPISCIYALTGFRGLFELADCREAGFDDYFNKPVDLEVLFKEAEQSMEKVSRWTTRT